MKSDSRKLEISYRYRPSLLQRMNWKFCSQRTGLGLIDAHGDLQLSIFGQRFFHDFSVAMQPTHASSIRWVDPKTQHNSALT
jgi:hypothetical protein